jgi:hypothetical protein
MPLPDTTTLKDLPEMKRGRSYLTLSATRRGPDVSNNIGFDTDFTKTWGSHNIHIGGMIYEFQYNNFGDVGQASGNFSFSSQFTQYDPQNGNCYQATFLNPVTTLATPIKTMAWA